MPGCYVVHKDATKVFNFITLIKGLVPTADATVSQAYANSDAFPNAQNWSIQQVVGGNVFVGEGIPTPTATNNSALLGPTGTASKDSSVNSLPLISINIGASANNTAYSLSWNYT